MGAFEQAAVETALVHLGAGGPRDQEFGQSGAEQAPGRAVDGVVHTGHHAVCGNACGQALQLFTAFGAIGRRACTGRGIEQRFEQHSHGKGLGGVATGPTAVPRRLDQGLDLGRHRHRPDAGEDVLEAHLDVNTQRKHQIHELQCLLVPVRGKPHHR